MKEMLCEKEMLQWLKELLCVKDVVCKHKRRERKSEKGIWILIVIAVLKNNAGDGRDINIWALI